MVHRREGPIEWHQNKKVGVLENQLTSSIDLLGCRARNSQVFADCSRSASSEMGVEFAWFRCGDGAQLIPGLSDPFSCPRWPILDARISISVGVRQVLSSARSCCFVLQA